MRSAVEVYIEAAVYAAFVVFGFDLATDGEENHRIFGAVMIGVSIVKLFLINRKWNRQRKHNE